MADVTLGIPLEKREITGLSLGDTVYLNGIVHTARDEAHMRILECLSKGRKLPFSLDGGVIFHCGPLVKKTKGRWVAVSIGPTTSSRMNKMQAEVIEKCNVRLVVGKGGMDDSVVKAMDGNKTAYLAMTGGVAALMAGKIKKVVDVHWLDLGMPEAVWALEARGLGPLTVAIANGGSLYRDVGRKVEGNLNRLIPNL
jgi:fumarate hydratase subunit beta